MQASTIYYHVTSEGKIIGSLEKKPEALSLFQGYLAINVPSLNKAKELKIEKYDTPLMKKRMDALFSDNKPNDP